MKVKYVCKTREQKRETKGQTGRETIMQQVTYNKPFIKMDCCWKVGLKIVCSGLMPSLGSEWKTKHHETVSVEIHVKYEGQRGEAMLSGTGSKVGELL